MRREHLIFALLFLSASCCGAEAQKFGLRDQYRRDAEYVLREEAGREPSPTVDLTKVLDEMVAEIEQEEPNFFHEPPALRVPSYGELARAHAAAVAAAGEIPRSSFWLYYIKRWKSRSLNDAQLVLFERALKAFTLRKEAEKSAHKLRKKSG